LGLKKNEVSRTNNKWNLYNPENSFNEISSIAQVNSNCEFSQTDLSIAMDYKERELLNRCKVFLINLDCFISIVCPDNNYKIIKN